MFLIFRIKLEISIYGGKNVQYLVYRQNLRCIIIRIDDNVWLLYSNGKQFVKFVNMLMNDIIFLLDESLDCFKRIYEIQEVMQNMEEWERQFKVGQGLVGGVRGLVFELLQCKVLIFKMFKIELKG